MFKNGGCAEEQLGGDVAENQKKDLASLSYGWCGKILKVDLSSEIITKIDTHPYADRFLGGRGIATRLYWEYVPAAAGAFDPQNHLIFMTGPLTATGVQLSLIHISEPTRLQV